MKLNLTLTSSIINSEDIKTIEKELKTATGPKESILRAMRSILLNYNRDALMFLHQAYEDLKP